MPKGGLRSTSWKPTWKHGATKTIRVPIALAEQILQIAKLLDEGHNISLSSPVTDNKEQISLLDAQTKAIAASALSTALSMKRIAMLKESKKHTRANNSLIEQWRDEIEALQRAIEVIDSY
ncbi:hypothetical protein Cri9333_2894 [Crinalium epipsammum PCC 9333]|uniref:Uncharacterized protein n=1 Tax=Crinalium epipsammum PCC 9333 TaxID=1173022 RepID=K9W2S7_9CYAN|nr:hypothetical protein [Crinalium epipsammum]AFZ11277.1 hypothetical protein Cri9333_0290 [Crinalium epipsammum PCC 9333]AFZ13575.1 hypothetical protein Cri9333_2722 [Crinalium epipsammum PCC 9333]AFZ13735.1 hypothetical protein Cri9333_2894 [Crinalium epipsammum PCC 9333]